jgi:hypothetical protein
MSDTPPSQTPEPLPCDFLAFLAQRLGVEAPTATDLLGEAVVRYEPGPIARARGATLTAKAGVKRADARAEETRQQATAA